MPALLALVSSTARASEVLLAGVTAPLARVRPSSPEKRKVAA